MQCIGHLVLSGGNVHSTIQNVPKHMCKNRITLLQLHGFTPIKVCNMTMLFDACVQVDIYFSGYKINCSIERPYWTTSALIDLLAVQAVELAVTKLFLLKKRTILF